MSSHGRSDHDANKSMTAKAGGAALGSFPEAIQEAVRAALAKKAERVVVLDLRKSQAFTDFFVVCTGQSGRQVKAIVDSVEEGLRKNLKQKPLTIEGYRDSEWVLVDYFDFIVHVFTPQTREFYALERLWGSAERTAFDEPR
jgi:ribosome-associated protein